MRNVYAVIEHGVVSRVQGSIFGYHGWGTIARDEEGTLYAVASGFRVSHFCPFGKTVMYISKNDGKTWSPPIVINDTYTPLESSAALLHDSPQNYTIAGESCKNAELFQIEIRRKTANGLPGGELCAKNA